MLTLSYVYSISFYNNNKGIVMKCIVFASIFCIIFSSVFVHAMKEIPSPIENPTHVEFLNHNKIVIAGKKGLAVEDVTLTTRE